MIMYIYMCFFSQPSVYGDIYIYIFKINHQSMGLDHQTMGFLKSGY